MRIGAFGPLPHPHTLALYKDGKELTDSQIVKEAGIKPHDVLLLRTSTVAGRHVSALYRLELRPTVKPVGLVGDAIRAVRVGARPCSIRSAVPAAR